MQRLTSTFDQSPQWRWLLVLPFLIFGTAITSPIQTETAQAQQQNPQGLIIQSDTQEANSKTGVVTARGNVGISYPSRKIRARATIAQYDTKQKRILLTGNVTILQNGNTIESESVLYLINEGRFIAQPKVQQQVRSRYILSEEGGKGLIIQSNSQEANTKTETVIARGNVRLSYPGRKLQGRANILEYNIKQKQIVLGGNVLVVQNGSSIQGETITYLIEEGRFVATPKPGAPVQSIYIVPEQ